MILRRQLRDNCIKGGTFLGTLAVVLAVVSAFTETPPPEPLGLVLPAAVANESPDVVVAVPAAEELPGVQRPAFKVRRPLTWQAGRPTALQVARNHKH